MYYRPHIVWYHVRGKNLQTTKHMATTDLEARVAKWWEERRRANQLREDERVERVERTRVDLSKQPSSYPHLNAIQKIWRTESIMDQEWAAHLEWYISEE